MHRCDAVTIQVMRICAQSKRLTGRRVAGRAVRAGRTAGEAGDAYMCSEQRGGAGDAGRPGVRVTKLRRVKGARLWFGRPRPWSRGPGPAGATVWATHPATTSSS